VRLPVLAELLDLGFNIDLAPTNPVPLPQTRIVLPALTRLFFRDMSAISWLVSQLFQQKCDVNR
jgi:hypothetical protein